MVAQSEEKRSIPVAALIATLAVLICGGGAGWYLTRPVIAQQDAPTSGWYLFVVFLLLFY